MSQPVHIPVIGVIGGVGSGKSTLVRALAERRPVAVIDGDRIGHNVLEDSDVQEEIRRRFGAGVFAEGSVNRSALAKQVFGETEIHCTARRDLERIVHPWIQQRIATQIDRYQQDGRTQAVLVDAAVMLEAGWNDLCDQIVFIETPQHIREQRVSDGRGWTEMQLAAREASQWSLDRKRAAVDFILDNSGTVPQAVTKLEAFLNDVIVVASRLPDQQPDSPLQIHEH